MTCTRDFKLGFDIVERARELGVHTIVTDWYTPEESPAKLVADESWDVSWKDIDELERRCREGRVDGVTAGFSEFTVEGLVMLCERLDLPCYCTRKQLDVTRDKAAFKKACRIYGVPVARDFPTMDDVDAYPVIVKLVDRGGSIGISIADDRESLAGAYEYAMECSVSKRVIIEEYLMGTKVDAYYAMSGGEVTLLGTSDTIDAAGNERQRVVQSGWVLPSRYQKMWEETVDTSARAMIRGLGMTDGFLFLSGFHTECGIVLFECGFRLSGGHVWHYFRAGGRPDVRDVFIQHALTGDSRMKDFPTSMSDVTGLIVNYYAKAGTLSKLEGLDDIASLAGCGFVLPMCRIGSECRDDRAILTKLAMVHLYGRNREKLVSLAEETNRLFVAVDEGGRDMVYDRMSRVTLETELLS